MAAPKKVLSGKKAKVAAAPKESPKASTSAETLTAAPEPFDAVRVADKLSQLASLVEDRPDAEVAKTRKHTIAAECTTAKRRQAFVERNERRISRVGGAVDKYVASVGDTIRVAIAKADKLEAENKFARSLTPSPAATKPKKKLSMGKLMARRTKKALESRAERKRKQTQPDEADEAEEEAKKKKEDEKAKGKEKVTAKGKEKDKDKDASPEKEGAEAPKVAKSTKQKQSKAAAKAPAKKKQRRT
jgi:hypothetical protein